MKSKIKTAVWIFITIIFSTAIRGILFIKVVQDKIQNKIEPNVNKRELGSNTY